MYSSPQTRLSASGYGPQQPVGEQRSLNSELWHACAGPLVSVPPVGSRVVYFPQGHSEQVAASTQKEADIHIPSYPHLSSRLICQLDNVTLHADLDSDEVYTCLTLIPLNQSQQQEKEPPLPEISTRESKQPTDFFCKTLTASDTSTHGGFSIPRRAAEKVFPPLDYSTPPPQHPAQELKARDLHDNEWLFRHIYRGQPRRHLLTTGWSVFVSAKRLQAGDSVLFIRDDKGQLLLGIRRANRQQPTMPSSVLTSDSMHIGVLAAANHAAASNTRFTVFYNPRASPSEFVIPLSKYNKAVHHTQVSVGMRFRMVFETEESGVRRYMGTITGIGDLDPVRWPNSHWRSLKVGWDESTAGERQRRVSLWEIEPLTTPYLICPPLTLRAKRPRALTRGQSGITGEEEEVDALSKKSSLWLRDDADRDGMQRLPFGGAWISLPRQESGVTGPQSDFYRAMAAAALQEIRDPPKQLLQRQPQQLMAPQIQFNSQQQQQQQEQQQQQQQQQINLLQQQQRQQHQPQQLTVPLHFPDVNSVSVLQTSCSRPQSPMELSSLRGPSISAYTESDLHLSPTMTLPLQGLLGRSQQGSVPHGSNLVRDSQWFPSLRESPETQALPSCSQEQEQMQSDPRSHLLFGVSIDQPLVVSNGPAGALAPRSFSKGKDSQTRFSGGNLPLAPYRPPAVPEMPLSPGMMSGLEDNAFLQRSPAAWPPMPSAVPQSCRTFTKVYKLGSVGRSLDVTRFSNYTELRSALAHMFGIEGQLDPARSNFKVVFVDNEGDVLLVGDDPWEEFVNCVHCIRILSPSELLQMSAEGLPDRASVFESEEGGVPDSVQ